MRNFLSVNQLNSKEIFSIIEAAERFRNKQLSIDKQVFAANLFFEPSTRTKMSFIVAQKKLGIEVLDFHSEASSVLKGETLYDTARTFESIGANVLVIRHGDDTWYDELIHGLQVPIINAGAGKGGHPTQCMLDLATIYQEYGYFNGLKVVIAGDIKHSRVARSNAQALKKLGANVYLSAAPGFDDPLLDFPYLSMDEAAEICDVVMLLRIQHERHEAIYRDSCYLETFGLTRDREKRMKDRAIILHPAPINRGIEIDTSLVECKRSRIFKQMENGVYVRMAIIMKLLHEWGIINDSIEKRNKTYAI
ncbi:aspartate carbamoyltransferase catalytic subunit [Virgibacillus oceani]|uniref:Aspartate carbamoyltransferase n=1 Tax=Virgibacillus oceani TaxID=1479511 RepID=A0A917M0K1_9BACI|nr:aspartate carbamoyltransferase catalytic subunit [Virgibacillus oceani]GGG69600.1 aspartate carbamoyltransferase [Virgibacillus oceani]